MERQPQTTSSTLQQAAELLERSQQLLRAASQEEATNTTTAARVRQMTTVQLQRDPVLWAAYTRGWEDRTDVFRRATSGEPTTAMRHYRSRSPRRVTTRPAATARSATPMPSTRVPERQPTRPLMETPVPALRTTTMPPPKTAANIPPTPPTPKPRATATLTQPVKLNARQRRNQQRMRDHKMKMTSQQHRLEKPAPPANPNPEPTPAPSQPDPATSDLAVVTVPEVTITSGTAVITEQLTAATSQTGYMEISPEEEAELLGGTTAGTADTEDMEVSLMFFSLLPRHSNMARHHQGHVR
ncbi:mucin-2-like [Acyrthosiphon pisum]|uniref:Uncharacterized protein n=1 Tax=Acyrthosiphon pisum TaxID=7029 RepID=A0A8R2D859_ACYPI|nr:mucin-2-like [Acyrthosiphon pisum]|eukprot:XP_016664946.1 PREDICTED: mucin-2-like [Acyrthosiphon pisum]